MSKLINGVHHISIWCKDEAKFNESLKFYTEVLGLSVTYQWGEGNKSQAMVDTGNSFLEVMVGPAPVQEVGPYAHLALAADDPDACVAACAAAGYKTMIEPTDTELATKPDPVPIRIAFSVGPNGEQIEFIKMR